MALASSFFLIVFAACGTNPGSISLSTTPSSSVTIPRGTPADVEICAGWVNDNATTKNQPDITLSASSGPSGVTTAFAPATLLESDVSTAPCSKLTIAANSTAPTGNSIITVTAKGDGKTATLQVTLEIQ